MLRCCRLPEIQSPHAFDWFDVLAGVLTHKKMHASHKSEVNITTTTNVTLRARRLLIQSTGNNKLLAASHPQKSLGHLNHHLTPMRLINIIAGTDN